MSTKTVQFLANDGVILNGIINTCKENNDKILIQVHGMISNCFKIRDRIISREVKKIGFDTMAFNNRGSEVIRYIKKIKDGNEVSELAGTACEDVKDSYYDITGAIEYALSLGYTSIYLQGHSLGSTKIVYTYNRLKKEESNLLTYIKKVLLLSMVDLTDVIKSYSNEEYTKYYKIAEEKERENKILELMPDESFFHPISVKTFLRYTKYNKDIDFAKYDDDNYLYKELNNIDVPIFMRWGNEHELIKKEAEEQVKLLNEKIKNINKDIGYIDGANHGYDRKEVQLAKEICLFLQN